MQLQTFTQLVSNAAAAVQGTARQLVDLTVGSTLRATLEANASLALWLQWLILQVLQITRASTSTAGDLDSWMADFSLSRLPAVAAFGQVGFSRFVAAAAALVPVGTVVRVSDNTQSFAVLADPGNATYDAARNGYVLAAGVTTVAVPVAAVAAGSAGNVQAQSITLIAAALPGIDTVTNGTAFQGGLDAEADAALRSRFQDFLSSRARATLVAIAYAINSTRQGLHYTILENVAADGTPRMGRFLVTLDDGSGSPPPSLLDTVAAAIEVIRPVGSSFAVQPPVVSLASISLTITTVPGGVHADAVAAVAAAIAGFVNTLPIGAVLAWSRLAQVAYQASADVINVTAVLVNGGSDDLVPLPSGVVKTTAVAVN